MAIVAQSNRSSPGFLAGSGAARHGHGSSDDATDAYFLLIDPDTDLIVEISDALLYAIARPRAELVGKTWSRVLPEAAKPKNIAAWRASVARIRALRTTDIAPVQRFPVRRFRDGREIVERRYWSVSNAPVFDDGGKIEFIVHRLLDVTDLIDDSALAAAIPPPCRQVLPLALDIDADEHGLALRSAAERLFESDSLLATACRLARIGAWSIDLRIGLATWSPLLREMLQIVPATRSSVGATRALFANTDPDFFAAALERCIADGSAFDLEFETVTPDGAALYVRAIGEAHRDTSGALIGVHGGIQDITASHRILRRLSHSEHRLGVALDAAQLGEWSTQAGGGAAQRSAGYTRCFGYGGPLAEWTTAKFFFEHVHPDDRERVYDHLCVNGRQHGKYDIEYRVVWPDGTVHWLWTKGSFADGTAAGIVTEVTARRQSEEQLRLLEMSVANTNDIVLITETDVANDPGQRIVFVNKAFELHTGYRRDEVIGRSPRMFQGPQTDRSELDRLHAAIHDRQAVRVEIVNYTKAGTPIWLELDIVPMVEPDGTQTRFVSVQRDVTERRRVQERLVEQAALIDAASDAIIVRSIDGKVEFWNHGAERLYGWSPAETLGRTVQSLVYDDLRAFDAAIATVLETGSWTGEMTQRARDGTALQVDGRWTLARDATGAPTSILAINTDISARKQMEAQLRQSRRLEAIGQLTGGVAHDFNNLLTVILGTAEVLSTQLRASSEQQELAAMICEAAQRGADLTRRLLAFARRQNLQPSTTDLNALIAEVHALLQRSIGEDIGMTLDLAADLCRASVDRAALHVAVLNICLNARDAMPGGGTITIATANLDVAAGDPAGAVPGRYAMIAVSDTGTGISAADLPHVFDPFFTTKPIGKGTGLGLSTVYGFVHQSGGFLQIASEPGAGTVVRIFLPEARQPAIAADDAGAAATLPIGSEHILIVEDDELVRHHVGSQLRSLGYQVAAVTNGPEALALLSTPTRIDLMFTDVIMPGGLNGRELAERAMALRAGLRILYTSGYSENAFTTGSTCGSGDHFLQKPYRRFELANKIRDALE